MSMTEKERSIFNLINERFSLAVMGRARSQSQFGITYKTYAWGVLKNEGQAGVEPKNFENVIKEIRRWLKKEKQSHIVVWRELPEEMTVKHGRRKIWKIVWRLHTIYKNDLIVFMKKNGSK